MKAVSFFRTLILLLGGIFFSFTLAAQDNPANRPSPPATASGVVKGKSITINYSSPGVKGREIWGSLVPYNQVWRAGANEATTFETTKDVKIRGQVLPAGKYAFFAIPGEKTWTVIFNNEPNQWGAYNYDQTKDALRAKVKVKETDEMYERLEYAITKNGFELRWEHLVIRVPVK